MCISFQYWTYRSGGKKIHLAGMQNTFRIACVWSCFSTIIVIVLKYKVVGKGNKLCGIGFHSRSLNPPTNEK